MSDIPPELVTDILSRLAVEPLLRFRSVSKPWMALIDSPEFIKTHLNNSILTNSHRTLIVSDCHHLYSLDLDSLQNPIRLNHPLKSHQLKTEVFGSTNGLLCLYNSEQDIALWNPFTRTHHNLPLTDIVFPVSKGFGGLCHCTVYGFGYDHLNDDYKVVRMIQSSSFDDTDDSFYSQVKIYSFNSNSWKRVADFPYYLRYVRTNGVFANGALHWVVCRTPQSNELHNLIGAFDLGTGEYRLVAQPDYWDADYMNVGVLGGCLCVISNCYLRHVDIWVMKEYGVKESWTKLISVAQPVRSFQAMLPMSYSKGGEKVLLGKDTEGFVWYDLEGNKVEKVRVDDGLLNFTESSVCVESLVKLPDGGGRNNGKTLQSVEERKKDAEKNKQVPNKRDDFLAKGFKLVL